MSKLPTFAVLYNKKDIFSGLVLKGLVGLHRTVHPPQHYWTGYRLGLHDIEWFALETNRDHSVIFETASSTTFWTLLLTMMATPFLLRDFYHSSRYNGHLS